MTFTIEDGVAIAMRDGCTLRADIWLPDGDGPWPVLLQRTPYRREDVHGAQYISALEYQAALRRGYAIVVQDTRGRFASDGDFTPFVHEAADGADTIAWLRGQGFCDGRVGMFGASYVGATQVLAAIARPEGLMAIAPQLTTARHGETWTWRGGALELGFVLLWVIEALAGPDLDRRAVVLGPERAGELAALLARMQADPQAAFAALPLAGDDLFDLAPYLRGWMDAARAAGAGGDREHLDALSQSPVAMLVTAGINDIFVEGSVELFETALARGLGRDRLILGPWSHGNPKDWQGEQWHGYAASTAFLSEAQLDFFDHVFRGGPDAPLVRYFRTGTNDWRSAGAWPLPGTRPMVLHLDGPALAERPGTSPPRAYVADPLDPVPTTGGATFLPGLLVGRNSGVRDQQAVEARADVLCFTSDPLPEATEITGPVRLSLQAATDAPSTDWTARLCEVLPDGRSLGLVDGIQRVDGAAGSVDVRLGHLAHVFARGSRIRLQVASSNFPRFDRNPQSGVAPALAGPGDMRPARQVVHGGRLTLPVVPAGQGG